MTDSHGLIDESTQKAMDYFRRNNAFPWGGMEYDLEQHEKGLERNDAMVAALARVGFAIIAGRRWDHLYEAPYLMSKKDWNAWRKRFRDTKWSTNLWRKGQRAWEKQQ